MPAKLMFETVSFEGYLAGERDVDFRSEFVDGHIYAMAGVSETHNTIANVSSSFGTGLEYSTGDGFTIGSMQNQQMKPDRNVSS